VLGVSAVLFQMLDYLGAFPFCADAPAILGIHQFIMVIVIMTERYKRVLKHGSKDRTRLFFRSLAVYDRLSGKKEKAAEETKPKLDESRISRSHAAGFAVDEALDDYEDDDDDDLALAAIEYVNAAPASLHL
jgi:hypothetical protein